MIKFNTPTLIAITAPTCSGKSFLLDTLTREGLISRIVSTTTRLPREGEITGIDYDFISVDQSKLMEQLGKFFELIEFNGTRYGVTHDEMVGAMAADRPPAVILEPQGLEIYTTKCRENGWNIFKIYVHVAEDLRVQRLHQRTAQQLKKLVEIAGATTEAQLRGSFDVVSNERLQAEVGGVLKEHDRRLLSITGLERAWSNSTSWDAIVPGDDVGKAVAMIEQGVKWRNERVKFGFN